MTLMFYTDLLLLTNLLVVKPHKYKINGHNYDNMGGYYVIKS